LETGIGRKIILATGEFYEGDFLNGLPNGKIKYQSATESYGGDVVAGEKEGNGTETLPNKIKYAGQFKNGKRNGKGVLE
jgi:hypothetical protein